jgi:hypothetical protein
MGGQLGKSRETEDVRGFALIIRFRFCSIFHHLHAASCDLPQLQSQGLHRLFDLGMEPSCLERSELLRRGVWQKVSVCQIKLQVPLLTL